MSRLLQSRWKVSDIFLRSRVSYRARAAKTGSISKSNLAPGKERGKNVEPVYNT